ncbi:MAG: hypothetical protein ACK5UJ_00640 [Pseudobdellovibrionaceae bacterium]
MKKLFCTKIALTIATLFAGIAHAAPTINVVTVQGLVKRTNNTYVSEASFNGVFAVMDGSTCLWAKAVSSVPLSNGYFSTSLSGLGDNVTAGTFGSHPASGDRTLCTNNYSAVTLNSALIAGATGALKVKVFFTSAVDTSKYPAYDITIGGAPVAMVAGGLTGYGTNSVIVSNSSGITAAVPITAGQFLGFNGTNLVSMAPSAVSATGTGAISLAGSAGINLTSSSSGITMSATTGGISLSAGTAAGAITASVNGTQQLLLNTNGVTIGSGGTAIRRITIATTGSMSATTVGAGLMQSVTVNVAGASGSEMVNCSPTTNPATTNLVRTFNMNGTQLIIRQGYLTGTGATGTPTFRCVLYTP